MLSAATSPAIPRPQRVDIQVLRGLAIVLVLMHHARLPFVPGGFLGVDIFFVISGFLMAGLIDEGMSSGRFTFASFYARRVRRLMPAAYATLVVTALLAPFLLDASEYRSFVAQLAGSFGFFVNFVLWQQTDYFGSGAELKPLLHMWSLSVEEQFYIVLPLGMLLATRRFRLAAIVAMVVASGALCVYLLPHNPSGTFYMLPTRAWELSVGSIVALLVRRNRLTARPMPLVRLICAAILLLVPLLVDEAGHPGLPAALCCLATAVLLVPGANLGAGGALAPMAWIGDRSYSLYLVHWPVFSFINNVYVEPVPQYLNVLLLLVCLVWTELQFRLIEQPYRKLQLSPRVIAMLVLIPVIAVGASYLASRRMGGADVAVTARNPNHGLSSECTFKNTYERRKACESGPGPDTMVWGDSFAMHTIPGLLASATQPLAQATRYVCGPFVGLAPIDGANFSERWGRSCIAFNDSVIAALAKRPEIRYVVLSSSLLQYIPQAEDHDWRMLVHTGTGFASHPQQIALLKEALRTTVTQLRAAGKRVILFAPPPSTGMDTARCLERRHDGVPTVSGNAQCTFSRAEYQRARHDMLEFLKQVEADGTVPVLSLDDYLCGGGTCRNRIGAVNVYQDKAHLSIAGSRELGTQMNWTGFIAQHAH